MNIAEPCWVDVRHAEAHLPELVERVEDGEEIVISRVGKPAAKLISLPDNFDRQAHSGWEGQILLRPEIEGEDEEMLYAVC